MSWLFLVLFCLAAPLALVAGWARVTMLTSEGYTAVVGGLATDAGVQAAIARHAAALVEGAIRGENPTATAALLAGAAATTVAEAVRDVVAGEAFAAIWREAHRALHGLLFSALDQPAGQPAVLDLSPALPLVQEALVARQIDLPPDVTIAAADLRITLLDTRSADAIRRYAGRLEASAWLLLVAALLALLLAVGVATDRLAALARVGFGLTVGMVALILLLIVGQRWLTNAASTGGGGEVIGAVVDAASQGLRVAAVALALLGLLLAGIFTGLRALRGPTPRRGYGAS